jgi:hypothetical protein
MASGGGWGWTRKAVWRRILTTPLVLATAGVGADPHDMMSASEARDAQCLYRGRWRRQPEIERHVDDS